MEKISLEVFAFNVTSLLLNTVLMVVVLLGELLFLSSADNIAVQEVVLPVSGRVVIFSSGPENPHRVERVTSGQRFVLAFWFTRDKRKKFEIFLDGKAHKSFQETKNS